MEYVIRTKYHPWMEVYAMSRKNAFVRGRLLSACFADLSSDDRVEREMSNVLDFLYPQTVVTNGTSVSQDNDHYEAWLQFRLRHHSNKPSNGAKGHATSHDPELRLRLIDTIRRLDEKYYGGDVSWLNSVLPCQAFS